jgi:hypothetical protein
MQVAGGDILVGLLQTGLSGVNWCGLAFGSELLGDFSVYCGVLRLGISSSDHSPGVGCNALLL